MKKLSILATMLAITFNLIAQNQKPVILKQGQDDMEELKVMYINDNVCYTQRIYGIQKNCWSINNYGGNITISDLKISQQ